jgi:hypothetical protein
MAPLDGSSVSTANVTNPVEQEHPMRPEVSLKLVFSHVAAGNRGEAGRCLSDLVLHIAHGGRVPDVLPQDRDRALNALRAMRQVVTAG